MVLDRRRFLTGAWPAGRPAALADRGTASCAVLVHARPDRLDQAIAAVEALGPVQFVRRDARGRLTFTLPAGEPGDVSLTLDAISRLPGVLSATLAASAREGAPA